MLHFGLLASSWLGGVYAALLFAVCFSAVHIIKLARRGYRDMRKPPEAPPEEKPAEPVYYIVEKKKKRPKAEYSAPKRVTFKD